MLQAIGTTFYTSLIFRKAPGTMSSLAVFLFFYLISVRLEYKLAGLIVLGICHWFCFPYFRKKYSLDDPQLYTLDEAFAMVLLSTKFQGVDWLFSFLLFRFFDIFKPLGIKQLEALPWIPLWIRNILDDIVAALYSGLVIIMCKYVLEGY